MGRFRHEHAELIEAEGMYSLPAFAAKRAYLSESQMRRVIRNESRWPEYGIYGARKVGACWLIATSQGARDKLMALASTNQGVSGPIPRQTSFSKTLVLAEGPSKSFFGYCEPFALILKGNAASGRFVEAPLCADMEIERSLLAGERDLQAVYDRAIQRYNREIDYWQWHWAEESCDGVAVAEAAAQTLVTFLGHNRDALRYYRLEGATSPYRLPHWPGGNPHGPAQRPRQPST